MNPFTIIMAVLAAALFILNVYQYLTQRSALRIADILYIMSRNVREKAAEVRRDRKDVEIVEAHLFDISTSARSLLKALGRTESAIGPDPAIDMPPNGNRLDTDSLLRLADNILYSIYEEAPEMDQDQAVDRALARFTEKVPSLDRDSAKKIVAAVARQVENKGNGPLTLSVGQE